jgi:Leucine-rich repeat (LRR) protein
MRLKQFRLCYTEMKFKIILTLVIFQVCSSLGQTTGDCAETEALLATDGKHLKKICIIAQKKTFADAEENCINNGMHLFSIENKHEFDAFSNFMTKKSAFKGKPHWSHYQTGMWINGKRDDDEQWYSYTPEKKNLNPNLEWMNDKNAGESCLSLTRQDDFLVSGYRCSKLYMSICQFDVSKEVLVDAPKPLLDTEGNNAHDKNVDTEDCIAKCGVDKYMKEIEDQKKKIIEAENQVSELQNQVNVLITQTEINTGELKKLLNVANNPGESGKTDSQRIKEEIEDLLKVAVTVTDHEEKIKDLENKIQDSSTNPQSKTNSTDGNGMQSIADILETLEIFISNATKNGIEQNDIGIIETLITKTQEKHEKIEDIVCHLSNNDELCVLELTAPIQNPFIRIGTAYKPKRETIVDGNKVRNVEIKHQRMLFNMQGYGFHFPDLEYLTISSVELDTVQRKDFNNLKKLKALDISHNNLKEIKSELFGDLKELIILDLSHNKIKNIDSAAFTQLEKIKEIRLNDNLLESLDYHFFKNNLNLYKVFIQQNRIILINTELMKYFITKEVYLKGNECIDEDILPSNAKLIDPDVTCNVPSLRMYCRYSGNYKCNVYDLLITKDNYAISSVVGQHKPGKTHNDVKSLMIIDQHMEYFPSNIPTHLANINEIFVNSSDLKQIRKTDLNVFINVEKIVINKNYIKSIEENSFDQLQKLKIISLIENKLKVVPEFLFAALSSIEEIYLDKNDIEYLSSNIISANNKLQKFSISSNELQRITPNIFMPRLLLTKYVDFRNNKCINVNIEFGIEGTRTPAELFGIASCHCTETGCYK